MHQSIISSFNFIGSQSRSSKLYTNAEEKSIIVTKWPLRVSSFNFAVNSFLLSANMIFLDWLNGDIDPEHWELIYKLRYENLKFKISLFNYVFNNIWYLKFPLQSAYIFWFFSS